MPWTRWCWILIALLAAAALAAGAQAPVKPRLVLVIVVDQFRYDYLTRFDGGYSGGIRRLMKEGAVYTNAFYEHFPTVTAIGHSTILSGAPPSVSGIVGNDWFDRETGRQVTSVFDSSVRPVGGSGSPGASPRRLLVSTVGDEMKRAFGAGSRVVTMSIKDRSAIMTGGHMADGAYWYNPENGGFMSSSFYFDALPAWVGAFAGQADQYRGAEWMGRKLSSDQRLYRELPGTPFANDLLEAFAEKAVEGERLGADETPDLLVVSFSANDLIGHDKGPDSPEVKDVSLRTDQVLEKLFRFLDGRIGMSNVLAVFTSDHGVAPIPQMKMPGGRMPPRTVTSTVQEALARKYGEGKWIASPSEHSLYLDQELMRRKALDPDEVARTAREAALAIPHVLRVYTAEQLRSGQVLADQISQRVLNGFYEQRGADLFILLEPYWLFTAEGTTHGTAFSYDAHVPVIFMGPGIRAGWYHQRVAVNDVAPTLATLLSVETPSGSNGRVLLEMLAGF